jgi:membrane associated rhomboid family serine protease
MSEPEPPPNSAPPAREEPSLVEKIRAAPITGLIVALNVAFFIWLETHGSSTNGATLMRYGALEPLHVWTGEYWRLLTSMFMHQGFMHIAMNMYVLVGWGAALERALGPRRFLLLYMLAGLGGGCVSVASGLFFAPHSSVGASGALFGIIGAVLALRRRQMPDLRTFFANPAIRSLLIQIGLWTAIGSYWLHLDNAAHLGGFITGFAVAWIMTSQARRNGWLALAAVFGVAFIVAARPWWTPSGDDVNDLLVLSRAYFTGEYDGKPWPKDVARGERFLNKGCTHGIAHACLMLADHLESLGLENNAKAEALRHRGCEIEPGVCQQQH